MELCLATCFRWWYVWCFGRPRLSWIMFRYYWFVLQKCRLLLPCLYYLQLLGNLEVKLFIFCFINQRNLNEKSNAIVADKNFCHVMSVQFCCTFSCAYITCFCILVHVLALLIDCESMIFTVLVCVWVHDSNWWFIIN